MNNKKDLHAFPFTSETYTSDAGLTIRDYFAGQALAGEFAAQAGEDGAIGTTISNEWMIERCAMFYRMADAMLAARDK